MSWKCRYFENLGYRDLMMDYWNKNPVMRWSAAPKPRMLDSSYQMEGEYTLSNTEIMFDAADCRRFGKDVFMQTCHTANMKGFEWVKRTLAADGVRVHHFDFEEDTYVHLDGKIAPVCENTLLYTSADRPTEKMLQLFKENEWNLIEAGTRESCVSRSDMCGLGIHMNMFALGPNKIVVEANEKKLIKQMRDEGIDVIPQDYSICYQWGGGLNCWTLDTVRDGDCKSYFPTFDVDAERQEAKREFSASSTDEPSDSSVSADN